MQAQGREPKSPAPSRLIPPTGISLSHFWRGSCGKVTVDIRARIRGRVVFVLLGSRPLEKADPPPWWVERAAAIVRGRVDVVEVVPH